MLVGCATNTSPNPWDDLQVSADPAQRAVTLPEWPAPVSFTSDTVTFDLDGAKSLERFQIVAEGNTDIAEANADEIDALNRAAAALIEAGQRQRALTELQREILEDERRRHFIEKVGYWFGFAVIIAAASL